MLLSEPQPGLIVFALYTLICGTSNVTRPSLNSVWLPSVHAPRAPGAALPGRQDKAGPSRGQNQEAPAGAGAPGAKGAEQIPCKTLHREYVRRA